MLKLLLNKFVGIFICLLWSCVFSIAGNYTINAGESIKVYCTATAPAGYITHAWFNLVNPSDAEYLAISYSTPDLCATIYGISAAANIPIEVTYAYSYRGSYDNMIHVGHGTYYDYITVKGSAMATDVTLTTNKANPIVGEPVKLTANFTPAGSVCPLNFQMMLTAPGNYVAEFDGWDIIVRFKKAGTFYPMVVCPTNTNISYILTLTVKASDVTTVALPNTFNLVNGDTASLVPNTTPAGAYDFYSWTSSDYSVVDVSETGVLTGKAVGTAKVYCVSSGGITSNYCTVTVKHAEATDVTINPSIIKTLPGKSYNLVSQVFPSTASQQLTWSSTNSSVATVTSTGALQVVGTGEADILARASNGMIGSCKIVSRDFATICVKMIDGSKHYHVAADRPNCHYAGNQFEIRTTKGSVYYDVEDIVDIHWETQKDKTSINELSAEPCMYWMDGETIYIKNTHSPATIGLYDISGRCYFSRQIYEVGDCQIPIQKLPSGTYLLQYNQTTQKITIL